MSIWRPGTDGRTRCWRAGALALLLAVAALPAGALAQGADEVKVMLDRMERLERDIRTLNLQLSRGGGAPAAGTAATAAELPPAGGTGPAFARLGNRLSELESDLRAATGAMEELTFHINEIRGRLDKLVSDVDYRLGALEGRGPGTPSASASASPPPPRISAAPAPPPVQKVVPGQAGSFAAAPGSLGTVSADAVARVQGAAAGGPAADAPQGATRPALPPRPAPAAPEPVPETAQEAPQGVLPAGTPKEQYSYAFGLLRQANYDKAELALQEFVKSHPKEPLSSNARYWLGETYYVRAAYVQAAEAFLEGYQADTKGPKAPDSLLKLGMSLAALDKKREACAAFDKLIKDFPDIAAGIKNTVNREKQKSGCS